MQFNFEKTGVVEAERLWNRKKTLEAGRSLDRLLNELKQNYQEFTSENPSQLDYERLREFCSMGFTLINNAADSIILKQAKVPVQGVYHGRINVKVYANQEVRVEVDDNGRGIDPKVEPFLFRNLLTTDVPLEVLKRGMNLELDLSGGEGVGLYIVERKVRDYQGTVGYSNKGPNNGAVFWYEVPIESLSVPLQR